MFALTGFMGYSLGPVLAESLALPGGAQIVTLALAATGATFLALSAWVLTSRRDFSFMGGFLFAGIVIALIAGLAAVFLQMPALGLAVAAMVALLSAGLILFETSRIVTGGESNYVLATVGLYVQGLRRNHRIDAVLPMAQYRRQPPPSADRCRTSLCAGESGRHGSRPGPAMHPNELALQEYPQVAKPQDAHAVLRVTFDRLRMASRSEPHPCLAVRRDRLDRLAALASPCRHQSFLARRSILPSLLP